MIQCCIVWSKTILHHIICQNIIWYYIILYNTILYDIVRNDIVDIVDIVSYTCIRRYKYNTILYQNYTIQYNSISYKRKYK